ncbi:MAG: class I SAM-dependent methyltransferase [Candidatus Methylomirabilaceae bacterium]
MSTVTLNRQNAEFWNELCGTGLARSLGISEPTRENLRRFDDAYLRFYPYLGQYVFAQDLQGQRVLEIGLGYGTLGQVLALQGCRYYGLDIAGNPVAMMRFRLSRLGLDGDRVQVGSAVEIPYRDRSFDFVYSIGCLHHTGDLGRGIAEVHRVLKEGGKAVIMLYNRHSFRQMVHLPLLRLRDLIRERFRSSNALPGFRHWVRAFYDRNMKGDAAPHTDYVSRAQVRRLFRAFRSVRIESQNCDPLVLPGGRVVVSREKLLNNLARVAGLNLYITAVK